MISLKIDLISISELQNFSPPALTLWQPSNTGVQNGGAGGAEPPAVVFRDIDGPKSRYYLDKKFFFPTKSKPRSKSFLLEI